jgi:hypothetical protein
VINRNRSERGWRGGRRIAVLVSLVSVIGVVSLGSAGTASAAFTFCKGSAAPKSKGNPGKAMVLSWSCNAEIRAFGVASNKAIASFSNPPVISGTASPFVTCTVANGSAGFGCGIPNRAEPGTQNANSTGSSSTCGRSTTVFPAVPGGAPAVAGITGPPCNQVIAANSVVKQDVTLAVNPCKFKPDDPLNINVIAGGEPPIASFTPRGDTTTVGQYLNEPNRLKVKGYQGCQPEAKSAKKVGGAKAAAAGGVDLNPLSCSGIVTPKTPEKPTGDAKYEFSCGANIRTFALVSNRLIDFFGVEPEVHGAGVYSTPCVPASTPASQCASGESAIHQCEGPFPSLGFGCGFPDRQGNISSSLTYGRRLSAFNTEVGEIGFHESPCKAGSGPKPKVWIVAMNEPRVPPGPASATQTTGLFVSEPFQLAVSGYGPGPCAKAQPKGKSK